MDKVYLNSKSTVSRDLKKALNSYHPTDILEFDKTGAKDLFTLGSYISKWPDSINSKIFKNHIEESDTFNNDLRHYFKTDRYEGPVNTVTFFIRTYKGDSCWLKLLFSSIDYFAPGSKIVVCIEEKDQLHMSDLIPRRAKIVTEKSFCPGSIQQKYSKLTADIHCDSDFIIYLDSDSILVKPFELSDWIYQSKPCLEYTSYLDINEWFQNQGLNGGNPEIWRKGVSNAVGYNVDYEFSRRLEKIYRKEWLIEMRELIEKTHGMEFKEFISKQLGVKSKKDSNNQIYFSDFNYMGAFLWMYKRDDVHWINTSVLGFWLRPLAACQFHSHSMTEKKNGLKVTNHIPNLFFEEVVSTWESSALTREQKEIHVQELYQSLRSENNY